LSKHDDGPDEVFSITLKCGEEVEVSWYKNFFRLSDHIEFRGPISETGYRSHFVHKEEGEQLDRTVLIDHLQQMAEQLWKDNKTKHRPLKSLF